MKFEHFALNIPDTRAAVQWYTENLGLRIARQRSDSPYTAFLADDTGRIIIEIYTNPSAPVPDYAAAHPLVLHIAFVSADPVGEVKRLVAKGATAFAEERFPDGSILTMMRDPWGVPLQFVKRGTPFPPVPAL